MNGCTKIPSKEIRSFGFTLRIRFIKSLASFEISGEKFIPSVSDFSMDYKTFSLVVLEEKGAVPWSIS
jgi:hypothetical protein